MYKKMAQENQFTKIKEDDGNIRSRLVADY